MPGIDSYTKLMLHMDGTDGSTTFIDSSASAHTVTANGGSVAIEVDQAMFGQSALFAGSDDYLEIPDSDDFNFGSDDFTIDFWFRPNNTTSTYQLLGQYADVSNGWGITRNNSNGINFSFISAGITQFSFSTSLVDMINTSFWTHVEIGRNGTSLFIFLNGVKEGFSLIGSMPDIAANVAIGCKVYGTNKSNDFAGYIDEFRISKGICRHTDSFVPPKAAYDTNAETDNLQLSSLNFNIDVEATQIQLANLSLETEIGIGNLQLANLALEVEIEIPTTLEITDHVPKIEILEYLATGEIDSIPDIATMILVDDHGLNPGDFFVNKTARDASSLYSSERGSRRVLLTPDSKEIGYNVDISTAQVGDEILLFRFLDVTQYLRNGTLQINKKSSHANSANFKFILPIVNNQMPYNPHPGQYVRITIDDELFFLGILSDTDLVGVNDANDYTIMDLNCIGLKGIPARRTVSINYSSDSTVRDIVSDLNDNILVQEGFIAFDTTYIAEGLQLGERWSNDCITIADVFDELASRNGFQWYVDEDIRLHFYKDPDIFIDAPYNLEQGGNLKFRNLIISHSIDNYINKNFVVGGKDLSGDQIKTSNNNLIQQNEIQEICAGSGVYGNVLRDSSIAYVLYRPAEAGTGTFTIYITGHGLDVGDYLFNATLQMAFWVETVIDENSFTVNETIYDQEVGDQIITYPNADAASQNILIKQGIMPKKVQYTIDHIFIDPQMKQTIELPRYGLELGIYNIESVTIKHRSAGLFESVVEAILRYEDNFTTQPHPNYTDYYRGF